MDRAVVAMSMDEYMRTSYEHEPEWVDGVLVERPWSDNNHANAQANLEHALVEAEARCRVFASPLLRLRVSASRWRVPDVTIFADQCPVADYPTGAYAAVEVLSPDESLSMLLEKCADYRDAGIGHIYIADPMHGLLFRYQDWSLVKTEAIEFPERGFRLTAKEIFA